MAVVNHPHRHPHAHAQKIEDDDENEDEILPPLLEQILRKIKQAGEFETGINVFPDDIKREIIKPAEAPDGEREENGGLPFEIIQQQQRRRDEADEQE